MAVIQVYAPTTNAEEAEVDCYCEDSLPWRRAWQPTPVFLPGKSHGQKSMAGCSPWGHKESDMTEAT